MRLTQAACSRPTAPPACVHGNHLGSERIGAQAVLERERIVVNSSGFNVPAPSQQRGTSQLVFDQASRTPDALALAFGGESLTYSDLCDRSNRLAGYLRVNGVR